jgi:U3 small nucleolar RNA-associated protein 19
MVDAEFVKDGKKTPVVEFEIPKKIFMKNNMESGVEDSLLVKLWDFN